VVDPTDPIQVRHRDLRDTGMVIAPHDENSSDSEDEIQMEDGGCRITCR